MNLVEQLERYGLRERVVIATLKDYREALVLGRLHVCGNCTRFIFARERPELGTCGYFHAEAWPFAPQLGCAGFEALSPDEAAAPDYLPDPSGALARAREYR